MAAGNGVPETLAGATPAEAKTPPRQHPFKGRTVSVVNDLKLREQWYLYQKTRELKDAVANGEDLGRFRLSDPEAAVYTIFMEDSTRTKESFRNAAEFHGMKVNVFDAKNSSFQKNETVTDTIKMLCGYSIHQSIFVIRSKMEGVCTWLEEAISEYSRQRGFPRASFINAGDGRHEHPSQEFLDEFSFLEQKGWDTGSIHLVLLGDLYHGRTVHSKVDGLRLYDHVEVDLVAPGELALPKMYEDRMRDLGYHVRKFASIDEYLAQPKVAQIWYFTRLQLERMGEKVLDKSKELRRAVTFQREHEDLLPPGTKFFHPLPRDARHPVLPFWLDNTGLNGWDQQSQNGYFTRIVLLGMLGGLFGNDLELPPPVAQPAPAAAPTLVDREQQAASVLLGVDFIKEIPMGDDVMEKSSMPFGFMPIQNGIIIERLAEGQRVETIWALMHMVRSILGLTGVGGQGVRREGDGPEGASGLISVPDFDISQWDRLPLKKLASMAPGSTLSLIREGRVHMRFELQVPPRIYNFPDISCKNTACVSHSSNMQHEVPPYFLRAASRECVLHERGAAARNLEAWSFNCKYCETLHGFWQIWDYQGGEDLDSYTI